MKKPRRKNVMFFKYLLLLKLKKKNYTRYSLQNRIRIKSCAVYFVYGSFADEVFETFWQFAGTSGSSNALPKIRVNLNGAMRTVQNALERCGRTMVRDRSGSNVDWYLIIIKHQKNIEKLTNDGWILVLPCNGIEKAITYLK
jgi:hypothetical protein